LTLLYKAIIQFQVGALSSDMTRSITNYRGNIDRE